MSNHGLIVPCETIRQHGKTPRESDDFQQHQSRSASRSSTQGNERDERSSGKLRTSPEIDLEADNLPEKDVCTLHFGARGRKSTTICHRPGAPGDFRGHGGDARQSRIGPRSVNWRTRATGQSAGCASPDPGGAPNACQLHLWDDRGTAHRMLMREWCARRSKGTGPRKIHCVFVQYSRSCASKPMLIPSLCGSNSKPTESRFVRSFPWFHMKHLIKVPCQPQALTGITRYVPQSSSTSLKRKPLSTFLIDILTSSPSSTLTTS